LKWHPSANERKELNLILTLELEVGALTNLNSSSLGV